MRRSLTFSLLILLLLPVAIRPQATVPSPSSVLGFRPGEDRQLADWQQITDYFKKLDAASTRVQVSEVGRSTLNRPMVLAVITAPENMAKLDRYREIARRLADPRTIADPAEAERLIGEGKTIVAVTCSIHSTEIVASQMSMELAYRLASDNSPETRQVLDNTIILLFPSVNPDGIDIVGSWYKKTLGTPHEGTAPPELYHHYTGHDNNRDFFMITQAETQALTRLFYHEWFPQIVYDVHQMGSNGARMFVPPFFDPSNPNIDPVILRSIGMIGSHMATDLAAEGFRGIVTNAQYDTWWAGGLRTTPYFHNVVGLLTEAASARIMTPITLTPEQVRSSTRGLDNPMERATNFPDPWPGGAWRPMDILNMELVTARSLFRLAARYREEFLRNFYTVGKRAVERGKSDAPFAYVIPPDQLDPSAAAHLVNLLISQGVEVHQASTRFTADGIAVPPGSYVILLSQPYRALVKVLMEAQQYPNRRTYPGGPPERPYDVAGWTVPMQMGVKTLELARSFETPLKKITQVQLGGQIFGSMTIEPGTVWLIEPGAANAFRAVNELLASKQFRVSRLTQESDIDGRHYPAGTFIITQAEGTGATAAAISKTINDGASKHGLVLYAVSRLPRGVVAAPLSERRIGLYRSWVASMDEGWTRWALDQFGFKYTTIRDADIRAGNLRLRFDAIILPSQSAREILEGNQPGSYPQEYTAGIGAVGATYLKAFVEAGGMLVTLGNASDFAIEQLGLPIKNVLQGLSPSQFYCPGSILRMTVDNTAALAYGLPSEANAYFISGPAFETAANSPTPSRVRVIARYIDDPLQSGFLNGKEQIAGKVAMAEIQIGQGSVVLTSFRPQHRGQPWGTFKLLFNALYSLGPPPAQ
jgi:hypothetical protein